MKTAVIIGLGFMGSAIGRALHRTHPEIRIGIVEKDPERRRTALDDLDAEDFSERLASLNEEADLVILAIKPQDLAILDLNIERSIPVVSVLAGTAISSISGLVSSEMIIRMMPNLAADIGEAVVGVCFSPAVPRTLRSEIMNLFAGLGTLLEVSEDKMHAITALSGSGIAFAFQFIQSMAMGGVQQGLPYPQALTAALEVVASAAHVLRANQVHPEEMVSRVCSPGGTTIEGIRALADGGLTATVMDGLGRAAARSRALQG